MHASEAVSKLQELMRKHGDQRVSFADNDHSFVDFEYNDDDGVPAFIFDLDNSDNE